VVGAEWRRSLRAIRAAAEVTGPRYAAMLAARSTAAAATAAARRVGRSR